MENSQLYKKLEKIDEQLTEISVILAEQAKDLKYHIKRSDQADAAIQVLAESQESDKQEVLQKIEPLQKHVNMVEGVMKFLGILAVLAAIYEVFKK